MFCTQEPGVVYLEEKEVMVVLDPGDIDCLMNEERTNCTALIEEEGTYIVNITRTSNS